MSIPDAEVGCLTIHSEALQKNTNKQLRQFVKETGAEAEDYTTRTELLEFLMKILRKITTIIK